MSPKEIVTILNKQHKQVTGYDGLLLKLIKDEAPVIWPPLSDIVNNSFDQSKFSTKTKFAEVGPIHRKYSQLEKRKLSTSEYPHMFIYR